MSFAYTAQNEFVVGVRYEDPVLQNADIGMSAFRNYTVAVQYGFKAVLLAGLAVGHDRGDQIKRFNIAKLKSVVPYGYA